MKTLEFRDGHFDVPDHIAAILEARDDLHLLRYNEALDRMNNRFLIDRLTKVQSDVVRDHISRFGGNE